MYADDTTVFVSDISSAQTLFQLLNALQECSGLEENKSKKEGLWLSANKNNSEESLHKAWPKDPILALGIHFSYDEEVAFKKNFEQKLSTMVSLLNLWYPRNNFTWPKCHSKGTSPFQTYLEHCCPHCHI